MAIFVIIVYHAWINILKLNKSLRVISPKMPTTVLDNMSKASFGF